MTDDADVSAHENRVHRSQETHADPSRSDEDWNEKAEKELEKRPRAPPQSSRSPQNLQGTIRTTKPRKATKLRVTMFSEGVKPHVLDVKVTDNGTFIIDNRMYVIAPGSVWQESGIYRAVCHDRNPLTIHAQSLTGDDMVTPEVMHGVGNNNLWEQQDNYGTRKSPWSKPVTWIGTGLALVFIGVIVWLGLMFDGNMEGIEQALKGLSIEINEASNQAGNGAGTGHNNIAPED